MIETIASYITILEALGHGIKYGQRVRRKALKSSARALRSSKVENGGDARSMLESALSRSLNAKQLTMVRRDLHYIEPVRICLSRMMSSTTALAPIGYATALQNVATEIGRQLENGKTFNLLGRHFNHQLGKTYLALPNTWSAIRLWSPIGKKLRLVLRLRGMAYLVRSTYFSNSQQITYYLALHMAKEIKSEAIVVRPENDFEFSLLGDGRLVKGCVAFFDYDNEAKPGELAAAICTLRHNDFSHLLRGLLLDYLHWVHHIWKEAQAGEASVRQMYGDLGEAR